MRPDRFRLLWFAVARLVAAGGAGALVLLAGMATASAEVTSAQLKQAVRTAVQAIKARQNPDGTWSGRYFAGGETCLATLALLQAGERPDSPELTGTLRYIRDLPDRHVYVVSLKIMVLVRADPQRYRQQIIAAVDWLARAQGAEGLWSYTPGEQRFDHSNSQFALLALHDASQAGFRVPASVWKAAQAGVLRTQGEDGGWSYQARGSSYGSMTAAAVADLFITGMRLQVGREEGFRDGAAPRCGQYQTPRPLAGGLGWMARNFQASVNPRRGPAYVNYWLYAVERCGLLSGQRYFGKHDWFREGAEFLIRTQRADGTWNGDLVDTCFALLFLARGNLPVLIQKLKWSDDDAWNPDRQDVAHLISFINGRSSGGGAAERAGAEELTQALAGRLVSWQVIDFDAPLEDWLAAPLLYMQGHTFPDWNAAQRAKVRQYLEHGGTLLAEACCGKEAFRAGFERFVSLTFPEFVLHELSPEHPIYHVVEECEPYGLMGLDLGCRTSLIFSPRDLSCLWEQGNLPQLSERAFRLGLNIAAYAMGRRPLRERLEVVVLPGEIPAEAGPPPRDALELAQVIYDGDWRPFPRALVNLAEFCRKELNLDVITRYRALRLTDPELYSCPILYLAGHLAFAPSEKEREALVAHLRRGGFLLVDNCCGPEPFDTAFRDFVKQAFPQAVLAPLPADHPIFRGRPGFELKTVRYGQDVARHQPQLRSPVLWGLELEGRLAIVYSPYALGCGLEGAAFDGCWGLASEDARRLAANIILYALTH